MSDAVGAAMRGTITARLRQIEAEEQVRILLAVESGSRAWGFHSPDSDYDVRFVYARPAAWHYRLDARRDVIERPIDDELDISGWELGKALQLACTSNAVIAEWLQSPIVYQADSRALEALQGFCGRVLDRRAVTWHYLRLLERQHKRLAAPEGGIRLKRFFYVLRPALALRWMRLSGAAMPPMDMAALLAGSALDPQQMQAIAGLTAAKAAAREKAVMPEADPVLARLTAAEANLARGWLAETAGQRRTADWEAANALHQQLSAAAVP